ncbi:MAG: FHA domain-containing protein [Planctomycetota bacterium]|jgi:pSer/pThr/pTyr-binding forkhead associated (FHA) protein
MKVRLVGIDPWAPKFDVVVRRLPATVGRSEDAEVRLDDRWASRRHCEFDQVAGTLVVRDTDSRHGTFVNGESIDVARVLPGDRLTIGVRTYRVSYRRKRARLPADRECEMAGTTAAS